MKKYSWITYTALILGLLSFLSLVTLPREIIITLLLLSVVGILLSIIGLFKKTERKPLTVVALILTSWNPVILLFLAWIMI